MKILCLGDIHLTDLIPRNRVDDYPQTQYEKLTWCFGLAHEKQCKIIILPGDIFDSYKISKVSDQLKRKYIDFFLRAWEKGLQIYVITGQHDLRYHNQDYSNTPFGVLEAAGCFKVLSKRPEESGRIDFYGASWEEKIPKIKNKDNFNILVIHKLLIHKKKIWPGQKNYTSAISILNRNKFDLIISGDNHQQFTTIKDGKTLINAGSLMRSSSLQINHKPAVYVFNCVTKKFRRYEIPIAPIKEVMWIDKIESEKERDEEIKTFIENLEGGKEISGLDYVKNLNNYIKKNKIDKGTQDVISEVLADIEEK